MRVRVKADCRIGGILPGGTLWYRDAKAGERLDIPEQFFNEEQFKSLEPKKEEKGDR